MSTTVLMLIFYSTLFTTGRGRSSSRGSSAERPKSGNLFIRAGSLKAAKAEMEQMMKEAEEMERAKEEKRARSAQKKVNVFGCFGR